MNPNSMFIDGGSNFAQKMVDDVIKWIQFVESPMFIIKTEWQCFYSADICRSMGIQWDPKKNNWCISSIPLKVKQTPHKNEEMARERGETIRKRQMHMDIDDPARLSYRLHSDEKLLDLLRATFQLDLATVEIGGDHDEFFECELKLYTVGPHGDLRRIFCNKKNFVFDLENWQHMCKCYLTVIKSLSDVNGEAEKIEEIERLRKRAKIDVH